MKKELLEKIKKYFSICGKIKIKLYFGNKNQRLELLLSGISYSHAIEALEKINLDIPVLKLGIFYPLPEKLISNFLKGKKQILVAEELKPYIEKEIIRIAKNTNPKMQIFGKNF